MAEAFLVRTVAHVWKSEIRRRRAVRRLAPEISLEALPGAAGDTFEDAVSVSGRKDPAPQARAPAGERPDPAREGMATQPPPMRHRLRPHVLQGKADRKVARRLHLSLATVRSHLHGARKRLAGGLADRLSAKRP